MGNRRFSYFIILAFIAGTLLLVIVQYNSARNTNALIENNNTLLNELGAVNHLREIDRDILGVESRIRASIATDDTSHLEGIDQKIDLIENFLDSLSKGNQDTTQQRLIARLSVLALEKKRVKERLLHRYLSLGNMNDDSPIANPRARVLSNEITAITAKIYQQRKLQMEGLTIRSVEMGRKAHLYDISLLLLLVFGGAVVGFHIVRQFGRQRLLIENLDLAEKKAKIAVQAKENFLANMSHEIRTPLGGILGFTNLLKKRRLDATSVEFVSSIQRSGENLMAIINDILDLSKIEAGMMRISQGVFSMNGLINSVETFFLEKAKEKGLEITSRVDPSIPDRLIGDATRLTQILVNLIGNAIKFTEEGQINISVYVKEYKESTLVIGFKVQDTGIGIEEDKLDTIFERFNQAEDSITRNYGGTGLGLSIAKNLVLLQNGNIKVHSQIRQGTTFDFYIPYRVYEEQFTELKLRVKTPLKDKVNNSLNVLVVDDNVMNQSLMKHLLDQWNIDFDTASNGLEAVEALKQKAFDLVLMDIQMPKMDGYAATQQIREELNMYIPIIAMTAHALAGEREKCLSHGMNEYISKPINEEELLSLISRFGNRPIVQPQLHLGDTLPNFYYIDLGYMKTISRGKQEFEQKVAQQFMNTIPGHVAQLISAFENQDIKGVKMRAHDLKFSVAMMGLSPQLEEKLDRLENMEQVNQNIQQDLEHVKDIIGLALAEVSIFLKFLDRTKN
jgi:signal transduction histidine kinase/CheY-like chemotaxis protein/HPt (histidine-containing phosphotransfer) domain-containing protein